MNIYLIYYLGFHQNDFFSFDISFSNSRFSVRFKHFNQRGRVNELCCHTTNEHKPTATGLDHEYKEKPKSNHIKANLPEKKKTNLAHRNMNTAFVLIVLKRSQTDSVIHWVNKKATNSKIVQYAVYRGTKQEKKRREIQLSRCGNIVCWVNILWRFLPLPFWNSSSGNIFFFSYSFSASSVISFRTRTSTT